MNSIFPFKDDPSVVGLLLICGWSKKLLMELIDWHRVHITRLEERVFECLMEEGQI